MQFRDIIWLWQASGQAFKGWTLSALKYRAAFLIGAIKLSNQLLPFIKAQKNSPIYNLMRLRPETIGAVLWPYQCYTWDAKTRLHRIQDHYKVIEKLTPQIDFPVNGALRLLDLKDVYEKFHIILDQPIWFMREGQLVLNLFIDNMRIFSLAFSFAQESGNVVAYVGAMQGRNIEGLLDTYRDITKSLHGMRPRDFLFELFRVFCRTVGVTKIYAVSDASRHHRSHFFGKNAEKTEFTLNYDEIWLERGGIKITPDYFEFSVEPLIKNLEEVPSKKRSMYRRRYECLDSIALRMHAVCKNIDDTSYLECPFNSL